MPNRLRLTRSTFGLPRLPEPGLLGGRPSRDGHGLVHPFQRDRPLIVEPEPAPGGDRGAGTTGIERRVASPSAEIGTSPAPIRRISSVSVARSPLMPWSKQRLGQLVEDQGLEPGECRVGRLSLAQHAARGFHRDRADRDRGRAGRSRTARRRSSGRRRGSRGTSRGRRRGRRRGPGSPRRRPAAAPRCGPPASPAGACR